MDVNSGYRSPFITSSRNSNWPYNSVVNKSIGNLRTTTKFTTTTSVDWERTGTRTSVSTGKRKLRMKSIGRSTTTTLNVNKHVEVVQLWCSFATKFFRKGVFLNDARPYFISRTSTFIDDEQFLVLSNLYEWKNLCFSYEDYSSFNLNEMTES